MDLRDEIEANGYASVAGLSLDDPNTTLEEHMAQVAEPIAYLGLPMVMDLKPQPGYQPASFAGTGVFDLHTDLSWHEKPPLYIGMYCVNPESTGGGIPLLSDGWKALKALDPADVEYLKTHQVSFPPPSHIDYAPLSGPIVSERNGKTIVRFRFDMLENPEAPVHNFLQAVNDCVIHLDTSPGTIFIFDNERMLHGRTGLAGGMASDRHYKRIYGDV